MESFTELDATPSSSFLPLEGFYAWRKNSDKVRSHSLLYVKSAVGNGAAVGHLRRSRPPLNPLPSLTFNHHTLSLHSKHESSRHPSPSTHPIKLTSRRRSLDFAARGTADPFLSRSTRGNEIDQVGFGRYGDGARLGVEWGLDVDSDFFLGFVEVVVLRRIFGVARLPHLPPSIFL